MFNRTWVNIDDNKLVVKNNGVEKEINI